MGILKNVLVKLPLWSLRKIFRVLFLASLGAFLIGIIVFTLYMKSLPALNIWHTTILENEFTAHSDVKDFTAYVALEKRLFEELDREIYDRVNNNNSQTIHRYTRNGFSDPKRWEKEWNKSFELPVENPKRGILLLHGLSDSPYSLHTQAEYLHKQGLWVVSMRLPGHGTIPSALREVKWQDWAAIVKIGMSRLREKVGDKPIDIMGYSTGAPLALNYTLQALEDETLTLPSSLIFYSPAIGVTKAAPLAIWQSRAGHLLGLPKLEWNSITPEYDPFKYGSFAVNAGIQIYLLCNEVQTQLDAYEENTKRKKTIPPMISFASIVDSSVVVDDTVNNLYARLKGEDKHTLVLFDVNHDFVSHHLIKKSVDDSLPKLREAPENMHYRFDLISDMNTTDGGVMQITTINGKEKTRKKLHLDWPLRLYSLSHLAMPISYNDPLYGNKNAPKSPGIQLGHLIIYGETSVLEISAASLLRQRWNPFHDYTKQRVLEFLELK